MSLLLSTILVLCSFLNFLIAEAIRQSLRSKPEVLKSSLDSLRIETSFFMNMTIFQVSFNFLLIAQEIKIPEKNALLLSWALVWTGLTFSGYLTSVPLLRFLYVLKSE